MAEIVLRKAAIDDLNAIWKYTYEKWSEKQADKYYATIQLACNAIGKMPDVGKEYDGIIQICSVFNLENISFSIDC